MKDGAATKSWESDRHEQARSFLALDQVTFSQLQACPASAPGSVPSHRPVLLRIYLDMNLASGSLTSSW